MLCVLSITTPKSAHHPQRLSAARRSTDTFFVQFNHARYQNIMAAFALSNVVADNWGVKPQHTHPLPAAFDKFETNATSAQEEPPLPRASPALLQHVNLTSTQEEETTSKPCSAYASPLSVPCLWLNQNYTGT